MTNHRAPRRTPTTRPARTPYPCRRYARASSTGVLLALLVVALTFVAPSRAALARPLHVPEIGDARQATDAPPPAIGRRVLGYYVPYDTTSWASLEANAATLTDVAAQWVTIDACGQLGSRDNRTLTQFARSRGIRVFPSLLTSSASLNARLLTDEPTTARAIEGIVAYVEAEGYAGFDLDLEGVRPGDRDAYSAFVVRLAAALHERGKLLTLAIPPKAAETSTGWAGAYDYAELGRHADLITIMAYEFSGAFSGPGSVAPHDWVGRVLAYTTARIPPEKVLLGLAFYGHDWNTTGGGSRSLSYAQAAALAEFHGAPIVLDPVTQSATFRYRATVGAGPAPRTMPPDPNHEIGVREAPPCAVATPEPAPPSPPRPTPPAGTLQDHEVWLEESTAATARLKLAERYNVGGVASWRLGLEGPDAWPALDAWRSGQPTPP